MAAPVPRCRLEDHGRRRRRRAWRRSAAAGSAYGLIALGLLSAFSGNVIGGMWLVFIGWFLRNAAISSYQQHLLLSVLGGVRAGQAMTPEPETVPADASVQELMDEYIMRRRYSAYPVVRDGADARHGDARRAARVPREEWHARTAQDVMVPAADISVRPEDQPARRARQHEGVAARRVLVMRDDVLLGIITASDIAFWLERARKEAGQTGGRRE
jgi:CBS domain-containing protein